MLGDTQSRHCLWLMLAVSLSHNMFGVARAGHNRIVWSKLAEAEAIAKGETAPTWQDLDESRKNSSRDQASHIPVHLAKIGCAIVPLRGRETTDFTFTDSEIELLAAAEHDRWNHERLADGWTLAEKKNVERKETPYLLAWKQLFQTSYEHVEGNQWRRHGDVLARPAQPGETIETVEGPTTASDGDWVVRGADGDEWPVPASQFAERYTAD